LGDITWFYNLVEGLNLNSLLKGKNAIFPEIYNGTLKKILNTLASRILIGVVFLNVLKLWK
jgi:hypothetical protein